MLNMIDEPEPNGFIESKLAEMTNRSWFVWRYENLQN